MVGGIFDRYKVEKNGFKECILGFIGVQNIKVQ